MPEAGTQLTRQNQELTIFHDVAKALTSSLDLDSILQTIMEKMAEYFRPDTWSLLMVDEAREELYFAIAVGDKAEALKNVRLKVGEGIAGWVAQHRKSLLLIDGAGTAFDSELKEQGVKSALSVPLIAKDRMIGVLNIDRSLSSTQFSQPNLSVVASFAGQLAMAIDNARVYSDLEGHFLGTITALAAAVDAKDPYTFGHSSGVTDHTIAIAEGLGLTEHEKETLRKAAILHDIGKIGIPGSILNKPDKLTREEFETMAQHTIIGERIISRIDYLVPIARTIRSAHERWDGAGYPDGFAGEDIPLAARILLVCDAFDAMTTDRPYRKALPTDTALAELSANAGTQFDPRVVDVFLAAYPFKQTDTEHLLARITYAGVAQLN